MNNLNGAQWSDILHELLENERDITEIEANGTTSLFIKKRGVREEIKNVFDSPEDYTEKTNELIDMITFAGDEGSGKFLAEGKIKLNTGESARVHIVLPPASDFPQITIAKKSNALGQLKAIQEKGSFSPKMYDFIKAAIGSNLTIVLSGGTGSGKALHKDTLIPTPRGWRTVLELQEGDVIYDEQRKKTVILRKYQPKTPDHYEITFTNGEIVKACGDHLWKVEDRFNNKSKIINTRDLFEKKHFKDIYIDSCKQLQKDNFYIKDIVRIKDNVDDYYCFTVSSPSHLFLCTKSNIPTHNTTMLEAMTKLFKVDERIGVVEDSPELKLKQDNVTYLHSTLWRPGTDPNSVATLSWCVQQINRQRVDKLIIGETRGGEFADFIVGANSGMEGSLTTIHANNARAALQKMSQFVIIGRPQPVRTANESIASTVDLIIQLGFNKKRENRILEIVSVSEIIGETESAQIATQEIFSYNEDTDSWKETTFQAKGIHDKMLAAGYDTKTYKKNYSASDSLPKATLDKIKKPKWGRR